MNKRFLKFRVRNNMTIEQVSKELNVSEGDVLAWEKGKYYPPLDVSMKLCELYNIRIDELCGTQENVNHQYNNIPTILMENWWKLLAMFSVLAYLINSLNKI